MPDAILTIVRDDAGERIVVTHADPVIWVADDLWAALFNANRTRIPGDAELDGDLLTFGTEGEGLGRLVYRRISYGDRFVVCEQVKP